MSFNKEIYTSICNEGQVSIFSEYWWLDAVLGKDKRTSAF